MDIRIGGDPTLGLPVANLQDDYKQIGSIGSEKVNENGQSFGQMLSQSLNNVSDLQNDATKLGQMAVVNPESVSVHEITVAMAKANMSLNLAKSIIDKSIAGFKEILNQR